MTEKKRWININFGRNKGRNILLAVIILAIIITTAISIIINATTSAIIEDYKSRFGSEVTISFDTTKRIPASEYKPLTAEQQIAFGESDLLLRKYLSTRIACIPENLKSMGEQEETETQGAVIGGGEEQEQILDPKAMLIGSNHENISNDFIDGLRKISDGRIYQNKNECLVSEQYAKLNHLSVGDTIAINSFYADHPMRAELVIAGIFYDATMLGNENPYQIAAANRNNEILVSFETAVELEMFQENPYSIVDAQFILKDPSYLAEFEKEIRGKGLQDYYNVSTDEKSYHKIVGPVEGLAKIMNTFLMVVLALGSVILILLSVLSIRERKYEIGVLRAMGMKKGKVAFGLLTESLVITAVCLCIGLAVGSVVSQPIANRMLQNQIEIAESNGGSDDGDRTGAISISDMQNNEKPLSEIKIQLEAEPVLKIVLVSLALALVSSLIGILYITKYEPMKILSERN